MTEVVEGGASLAWRLLATLEGGSLLLATSALLAYSARKRVAKLKRSRRPIRSVLLTNTSNLLGKELQSRLETRGCVVHTMPEAILSRVTADSVELTNGTMSGASEVSTEVHSADLKVDALIVVGEHSPPKLAGLQGMAKLVSEDVYNNLKLLESLSSVVRQGGCVAWACAGASSDSAGSSWDGTADAFDTVLEANLRHIAKISRCEPVWIGRCDNAGHAAEKLVEALLNNNTAQASRFSVRNVVHKAGEYIGRWLKIVS